MPSLAMLAEDNDFIATLATPTNVVYGQERRRAVPARVLSTGGTDSADSTPHDPFVHTIGYDSAERCVRVATFRRWNSLISVNDVCDMLINCVPTITPVIRCTDVPI
jgi:hypothetical protein